MTAIVKSLLENDLYKFPMWQTMLHKRPEASAEYDFICRSTPEYPLAELLGDVKQELDHLCSLQFADDELAYLARLRYLKPDFIEFLSLFRFRSKYIKVFAEGDTLRIQAQGPQVHVMNFEIFCLYIVSELYFRRFDQAALLAEGRRRLQEKLATLKVFAKQPSKTHAFEIFDFGLRRRAWGSWQEEVVRTFQAEVPSLFKGTSNVYLAKQFGLTPIGTMAHEYLQSYQAHVVRLREFQRMALEDWAQEFRGDLGVALTDTIGMDAFLRDFDLYFAKLFDGLRHDSGDPVVWGEKAIAHYQKLRINPHSKRLVFSDGLDIPKAIGLYDHFADRIQLGFGIGTHLTNDLGGPKPLNIVMKLVRCNGDPVAKLSDAPGKTLCNDQTFIAYLRQIFNHYA
ncbi:nicotinate phosphoribosyltransferase [Methylomonas rosea]|uniref:Nicotinate phosphoribosyltransferase n=1 Tax=Methylomonas rosea TaxID=2952227 RepID=A0ABT1TTX9_9GAMM|nr:nicotinate phosphoribosyltransferase [Methylomonas sp. WSC-7]MCQ8117932.1 nicotinate phosphoribosyltransferase [Methylomonas sp. WSC-7]